MKFLFVTAIILVGFGANAGVLESIECRELKMEEGAARAYNSLALSANFKDGLVSLSDTIRNTSVERSTNIKVDGLSVNQQLSDFNDLDQNVMLSTFYAPWNGVVAFDIRLIKENVVVRLSANAETITYQNTGPSQFPTVEQSGSFDGEVSYRHDKKHRDREFGALVSPVRCTFKGTI